MKLYATTTSERASKGQGGEHLRIDIQDVSKKLVYGLDISYCNDALTVERYIYDKNIVDIERGTKGNKQKGEICFNCKKPKEEHEASFCNKCFESGEHLK